MPAPTPALDLLTGDAQTFRAKVWARSVLQHDASPDRLTGLLTLDDADALLTGSALRTPAIRLAQDGAVLPESRFTRRGATIAGQALSGLVDARAALRRFDEGATVVLQGLHRYHPPLTRLVAALEAELGHPCQANAYLTPPGSQGFAVHADTHDVFVFQTHGHKDWQIHPLDDPDGPDGVAGARHRTDVRLEPGLVVYLPTGTPHAARAQDEVSLHVTIGITQLTWRSLVRTATADALAAVDDTHLPAGYLDDAGLIAEGVADRLTALADRIRGLDPQQVAERQVERFGTVRNARLRGGLRDVLAVRTLAGDDLVARRPGSLCVLLDRGDRVRVLLGDRHLDAPERIRPALEWVRDHDETPFRVDEVPLDPASALVLCRRLVREGLLETR